MINSSITFTNGSPATSDKAPTTGHPNPKAPAKDIPVPKQMEVKRLQRQKDRIEKRLKTLKGSVSGAIRHIAIKIAQGDPNKDPRYLYDQINPLLSKMPSIKSMVDRTKIELKPGITDAKGNSYYNILLRRNAILMWDDLDKIRRQKDNFGDIEWSAKGISLNLWWPYEAPEEPVKH